MAENRVPRQRLSQPAPSRHRLYAWVRWLGLLPFLGILGIFFSNRVTPLVLGMPFILAWIVLWILLSSLIMAAIFRCDPANRATTGR
ncbi:MAG TPA: DUF3311 domain-containing protein [Stellaceae bacterium]|nr:DUF3311 domain-containing protein [Stellaceae bacterium]